MALVLTRKKEESLFIGDIKVTVAAISGNQVRLAIEAPKEVPILREELRKDS